MFDACLFYSFPAGRGIWGLAAILWTAVYGESSLSLFSTPGAPSVLRHTGVLFTLPPFLGVDWAPQGPSPCDLRSWTPLKRLQVYFES